MPKKKPKSQLNMFDVAEMGLPITVEKQAKTKLPTELPKLKPGQGFIPTKITLPGVMDLLTNKLHCPMCLHEAEQYQLDHYGKFLEYRCFRCHWICPKAVDGTLKTVPGYVNKDSK